MTASDLERQRSVVASRLRSIEHELTVLLALRGWSRSLTEVDDRVPHLERLLAPVLDSIAEIADELDLPVLEDSEFNRVRGTLTLLSVWLTEITPDRLARQWGITEQNPRWPTLHQRLETAIDRALAELHSASERAADHR